MNQHIFSNGPHTALIRFHGSLKFFLSNNHHSDWIHHRFEWRTSIKDMLESIGPPHPEMQQLIVNEQAVDFSYIVQPNDRIEVYDDLSQVTISQIVPLRPAYPGRPRFVLDTHLGRLANYLRMFGFDTLYRNDYPDDELAEVSHHQQRILLTRDVGLLKRSLVVYGYYVRNTDPRRQLVEILRHYDLHEQVELFRHCTRCNGILHTVAKADIQDRLPGKTLDYYDEFHQCADCQQVYWKGSHFQRLQGFIASVMDSVTHNGTFNSG